MSKLNDLDTVPTIEVVRESGGVVYREEIPDRKRIWVADDGTHYVTSRRLTDAEIMADDPPDDVELTQ